MMQPIDENAAPTISIRNEREHKSKRSVEK